MSNLTDNYANMDSNFGKLLSILFEDIIDKDKREDYLKFSNEIFAIKDHEKRGKKFGMNQVVNDYFGNVDIKNEI